MKLSKYISHYRTMTSFSKSFIGNMIAIFIVCLLIYSSTGTSDVGPIRIIGKQIEFEDSTNVILERETVDILLSPGSAEIVCNFYLRNTGEPETLHIAFPGGDADRFTDKERIYYRETKDFQVQVNDQHIATDYIKDYQNFTRTVLADSGWYGWYTWESVFPSNEEVHIIVSYTALHRNMGFTYNPYGDFEYILSTGSLWKGNIGTADISLRLQDMDICQITDFAPQNGSVHLDKTIQWHLVNFEPDPQSNIRIWYEIDLFDPSPDVGAALIFEYIDSLTFQGALTGPDFVAARTLIDQATDSVVASFGGGNDTSREYVLRTLRREILNAGSKFQEQGKWKKAIQLYSWYQKTYGDITSDLRPYSILQLRLGECYRHTEDFDKAKKAFMNSMDPEPLDEKRYVQGLNHMFDREVQRALERYPFDTSESGRWKQYFQSKGLNEYCRINIDSLNKE
jgi:tetratricopeptide (TPR) repeat protein